MKRVTPNFTTYKVLNRFCRKKSTDFFLWKTHDKRNHGYLTHSWWDKVLKVTCCGSILYWRVTWNNSFSLLKVLVSSAKYDKITYPGLLLNPLSPVDSTSGALILYLMLLSVVWKQHIRKPEMLQKPRSQTWKRYLSLLFLLF